MATDSFVNHGATRIISFTSSPGLPRFRREQLLFCSSPELAHPRIIIVVIGRSARRIKQAMSGRREFAAGRSTHSNLFRAAYRARPAGKAGVPYPIRTFPLSAAVAGSARTGGKAGVPYPMRTVPWSLMAGGDILTALISFTVLSNA